MRVLRTCATSNCQSRSEQGKGRPPSRTLKFSEYGGTRPPLSRLQRSSSTATSTPTSAYFGGLSSALTLYLRQRLVAESSRDAEFASDNTLFRFGWRFDIAVVEDGQIERYPAS